jgi:hypothetical protein
MRRLGHGGLRFDIENGIFVFFIFFKYRGALVAFADAFERLRSKG